MSIAYSFARALGLGACLFLVAPLVVAQSPVVVDAETTISQSADAPYIGSGVVMPLRGGAELVLDNGPLMTCDDCGPGGAGASVLQTTSLGMNVFGFGVNNETGFRLADDFTIDGEVWTLQYAEVYAYQTGSTTASTITGVSVRIWDGHPADPASEVVYGDETTNFMLSTEFSGYYRVSETDMASTARPLMLQTVDLDGVELQPGQYWFDFSFTGSLASGPWGPPVTIVGVCDTGDALQFSGTELEWSPLVDTASECPQAVPFRLYGEAMTISTEGTGAAEAFGLSAAYPNPTAGTARVEFSLDATAAVALEVFDVLGRRVAVLASGEMPAGQHAASFDATSVSAGVYVVRLVAGDRVATQRITVAR